MKTKYFTTTFIFIASFFPIFAQQEKVPISMGMHLTHDFKENDLGFFKIGSDVGISCNFFLAEKMTVSSGLSYGYKRYDVTVLPSFVNVATRTQKIFNEKSISFDADVKYNVGVHMLEYFYEKNPSLPWIHSFVGLGLKGKLPQKIRGEEGILINPTTAEKEWSDFEIDNNSLTPNFGLKLIGGLDIIFEERYYISLEFGKIYFPKDGFKDLRDMRLGDQIKGHNKNENYKYFKVAISYIFNYD